MTQITVAYGVLDEENLISFFRDTFEINYDKQSFFKPSSDFVMNIYLNFIDSFNLNLEVNNLPHLQKIVNVVYCIEELLSKCNIFDFKISDILQPKRKRTQTFVSQLVGLFLDSVEFETNLIGTGYTEEQELREVINNEKSKEEVYKNEIKKKKADFDKLNVEIDLLNKKKEEVRECIVASRNKSEEYSDKSVPIKQEKAQLNSILSNKEYELSTAKAEIEKLKEDLKLFTENLTEQHEKNKKIVIETRENYAKVQEKRRELSSIKILNKENVINFKNKQEEISKDFPLIIQNLKEKRNFAEKIKACSNDIANLKSKILEIENDFDNKSQEKKIEIKLVEKKIESVDEIKHVLKRDLQKKESLEKQDENVNQLKKDTISKQELIDYNLSLKNEIINKFNNFNENLYNNLNEIISSKNN